MAAVKTDNVDSDKNIPVKFYADLPDHLKVSAIELFFTALNAKLKPILGNDHHLPREFLADIQPNSCFIAALDNQTVGILAVKDSAQGFLNPTFKTMKRLYGPLGGCIRLLKLALLDHSTADDELYIEGIAVDPEQRSKGIGASLMAMAEDRARSLGLKRVTLEVIDTNPRAEALYARIGFRPIKSELITPIRWLIPFPFREVTLMEKRLNQ